MNSPSLETLWKEHAAASGKTDPLYLETKRNTYPPTYKFSFDWSFVGAQPLAQDWTKDGQWNETWYYSELLNLCSKNFTNIRKRLETADRANAKRIEAWLKRVNDEPPSNELLSQYATYSPLITSQLEAAGAAKETKEQFEAEYESKMLELSKRFFKVLNNGQSLLYDVRTDSWTKYEDCVSHYGHMKVTFYDNQLGKTVTRNIFQAYKDWDSPTRYDAVEFNPRKAGHYDTIFNLWQGFTIKPEEGDEDLLLWDLLHRVCDYNDSYFEYVQKWFAHMIQKPWEQPGTCLGISGPQRLGKNALIETFGMLLASPAMIDAITKRKSESAQSLGSVMSTGGFGIYTSYDHVFGTFNYSTGSKLLLLMDEATWAGSNALKARFKTAITGATATIADKFVRQVEISNHRRYVLLSNNGDYLGVDADDGRLLPLEFKAENRPTSEWFDEFYRLRKDGKLLANLMHRLQRIDLTGWQPMQALRDLEITTGAALQNTSVPDYVHWVEDIAETGEMLVKGDKEEAEYRLPCCGERVEEDDLRRSFEHVVGKKGIKGWKAPDFVEFRNKVFGEKVQWRHGNRRPWGRSVPCTNDLRQRLAATSKWKYHRFDEVKMLDEPLKVAQFKKLAAM